MIDVKTAVRIAIEYMKALYEINKVELLDLLLEEVELSPDGRTWLVTLGFVRPQHSAGFWPGILEKPSDRAYKVIRVDGETGKAESMKIRELK